MNIKELEKLVETSFELKPGPLYIIGLNDSKDVKLFFFQFMHNIYVSTFKKKE